jgi:hypothetical protein
MQAAEAQRSRNVFELHRKEMLAERLGKVTSFSTVALTREALLQRGITHFAILI